MFAFIKHFRNTPLIWIILLPAMVANCAVISDDIRQEAHAQPPFGELIRTAGAHQDQTVIFGGYVVSVENQKEQTRMVVVQAPLGVGQQPKSKDLSKGRLVLVYDGFIDPEVFTKDRQVTVGGKLIGSSATENHNLPYPYLRVQVEEIHLWAKPGPEQQEPYWWDDDCYYHPFGFRRFHRHPYCW